MKQNLKIAILMTIVTTVLLGIIYPLVVTGLAQVLFRDKANGQLIVAQRPSRRIENHRTGVHRSGLSALATFGGRQRIRRRQLRRHQSGPHEPVN